MHSETWVKYENKISTFIGLSKFQTLNIKINQ